MHCAHGWLALFAGFALAACSSSSSSSAPPGGADASVGGSMAATGGAAGGGGVPATTGGAANGAGGTSSTGGAASGVGGSVGTGGAMSGGTPSNGGAPGNGGAPSSGGNSGIAGTGGVASGTGGTGTTPSIRLPPPNAGLDYQLGGAYPPPAGVGIVSRDHNDAPASGLYNICYVNGFQVQQGEESTWDADLILRDAGGNPIVDPDWNEQLVDPTTPDKRTRIAAKVGAWIDQCAADGFDAVEVDNLDSYSRSGGRITENDAVALLALLSARAHAAGLAIGQKNSAEIVSRKAEMGTDFAVAEECNRYSECGSYIGGYGEYVLMIEYRDADFTQGCAAYGASYSIVRRDLDLVTPRRAGYVFDGC